MATSSITENICVNNPKVIEEFLDAMDELKQNTLNQTNDNRSHVVSDPDRIRKFMETALKRSEQN